MILVEVVVLVLVGIVEILEEFVLDELIEFGVVNWFGLV